MKPLRFKYILPAAVALATLFPRTASALSTLKTDSTSVELRADSIRKASTLYERRVRRFYNFWMHLIPSQIKVQYAGSIGMVSAGAGWHYGRDRRTWETDLYLGYLPKDYTRTARTTMTLKQSYIPFRLHLKGDFYAEPLTCGMFLNAIFGEECWGAQPSKYPRRYYGFSTKFRTNIFIGQRLRLNIPSEHRRSSNAISLYYELSTNDLYVLSYVTNKYLSLWDILSLGFGVKLDLF
jgi:hypothetical protein